MNTESTVRRVVWVTGAGKGIGRALALRLASDGWMVAASARTGADLASLAAEAPGGRIAAYPLDITDETAVRATVAAITGDLGQPDLAVLNAGTHIPISALRFSAADLRALVEVNLMGSANCLAAVLPGFIAARRGTIAMVSSVAGYRGLPTSGGYGATKAALINLCEAFRPELERVGVDLRLINPGFVDTPLTRLNRFPMPFLTTPEAAAAAIVRGLRRRKSEIVFPWRMMVAMKLLRLLPNRLFYAVTRRITPA